MDTLKVNSLLFVPGDERRNLLRVVMVERVGTLYRSQPDHAVVVDGRLQEVFVMKEENCTDSRQLNNESLSIDRSGNE